MVTLLLCFFVLLYSISTVDQAKWVMVVKSFNPDAKEVSQIALDAESEAKDEVPGQLAPDSGALLLFFFAILSPYFFFSFFRSPDHHVLRLYVCKSSFIEDCKKTKGKE